MKLDTSKLEEKDTEEIIEELTLLESYIIPKSMQSLVEGYLAYAKEVIMARAIPMIDGFKPSQRRILYIMQEIERVTRMRKSADVAGSVTKIHPHSDGGIYDTMVRMTGASEYLNVPLLKGKGSFGKVYYGSEITAAAPRYTEIMLEKVAEELFRGMNGVEMIPSYNNELQEPLTLPVSFPSILCNPTEGIAVGIASKIPSFNFHEVIAATINYIEKGEYPKELYPDFTTGGYVVKDKREMEKILTTGKGRLKLRGNYRIEKDKIIITEIPYYATIKRIKDEAEKIEDVIEVKNETDRKNGLRLVVRCRTQRQAPEIAEEIIRVTPFQGNLNTNIVIIGENVEGKSVIKPDMGVNDIIKEWVDYRTGVLGREYKHQLEKVEYEIRFLNILVDLMTTVKKRDDFLETLLHKGRAESRELLQGYYEDADKKMIERILDRSLGSLGRVGEKQREEIVVYEAEKKEIENGLANIDKMIVKELKEITKKYKYPRKTKVTNKDYNFDNYVKPEEEAVEIGVQVNNKFIKKLRGTSNNLGQEGVITCKSDDIITMLDTQGRLLRIQLDDLEYNTLRDKGTYLPLYLEEEKDDYDILDFEVSREYTEGYIYDDGYMSVIDYNEWVDKQRVIKVIELGLAPNYKDQLLGKVHLDRGYVIVRTEKNRLGIYKTEFKAKSRRGRTKLISLGRGDKIVDYINVSKEEIEGIVVDTERYTECLRVLKEEDNFNNKKFESYKKRTEWGSKRELEGQESN